MLVSCLIYPVQLEPVIRTIRIAVEPIFRTIDRTTASCLVDKRFRHQSNFIKKDPGQSDTLDEVLRTFVLTAKYVKIVFNTASGYDN